MTLRPGFVGRVETLGEGLRRQEYMTEKWRKQMLFKGKFVAVVRIAKITKQSQRSILKKYRIVGYDPSIIFDSKHKPSEFGKIKVVKYLCGCVRLTTKKRSGGTKIEINIFGTWMSIKQLAEKVGVSGFSIWKRYKKFGYDPDELLRPRSKGGRPKMSQKIGRDVEALAAVKRKNDIKKKYLREKLLEMRRVDVAK